ncbi:MAG: hypothetical protein AB1486_18070 [Planctomycetota bacterium]
MKKLLVALAVFGLLAVPLLAQTQSLYDQEGTVEDGYTPINAAGHGPFGDPSNSWLNWKYQYGGGSWSGVYGDEGWIEEQSTGDSNLDIECDIEMYYTEQIWNNKIYFHLGNIYSATWDDMTAYVNGTFTSNNGMYIGICFTGTDKTESSFEKDGGGNYTGRIFDAMDGTIASTPASWGRWR